MINIEEHFVLRCECEECGGIWKHKVVTREGGETSCGSIDFSALVCKNCSKVTVTHPIPWPVGTPEVSREVAQGIVQELQEYVDANC